MKKLIFTGAVVFVLGFFSSCKKDWVCQCTNVTTSVPKDTILYSETHLNAKAKCESFEATLPLGNTVCSIQQ
jgi:hypothetical protein